MSEPGPGRWSLTRTHITGSRRGFYECQTTCYCHTMANPVIGFRPTDYDIRALKNAAREGETTTDTIRRAIRMLDHERWLEQARLDAAAMKDENLNDEPEAW